MADLTLHINQSGGWRRAMSFDEKQYDAMKAAALPMARILASNTAWKIVDQNGTEWWHFDMRRGRSA